VAAIALGEAIAVNHGRTGPAPIAWLTVALTARVAGVAAPAVPRLEALGERVLLERWFCGLRQTVETVYSWLTDRLGLKFPRARTYWGLLTRLAAKVAALNLATLLNRLFDRLTFAHLNPLG
jgi:hypothetical protein